MSIPLNGPAKGPSIFQYEYHDRDKDLDIYKLNTSVLSDDECHMFFSVRPCEELIIATALEFLTFHPANKKMNDKFDIQVVKCGDIELFWCNFPKEFKGVCERIAKVFGMTMKIIPRVMLSGTLGTALEFPSKENVLCFHGMRCDDAEKISNECEKITGIGHSIEKLGID